MRMHIGIGTYRCTVQFHWVADEFARKGAQNVDIRLKSRIQKHKLI